VKLLPIAIGLALGLGAVLYAQEGTPYIFHTYSNLIQIPVLALDEHHQAIRPDIPLKFDVSIDSGPPFPAPHVRLEGDDPISLAILLDMSGDQNDIISSLDVAIASLAPHFLLPQDHVSVYAVDCRLVRTAIDIPADASQLKSAVDAAVHSPLIHGPNKTHAACGRSLKVWDALSYVTSQLSSQPGRRVILAITAGHDKGSAHSWKDLKDYADNMGVAIFGLADVFDVVDVPYGVSAGSSTDSHYKGYEDDFQMLCELSGGSAETMNQRNLLGRLTDFITALRTRYIVEFPRPDALSKGPHSFLVTVADPHYFIRPAGISLPIADPAILADPSTLPSDPSHAPVVGNRKILVPAH